MKQNSRGDAPYFTLPDECRAVAEALFPPAGGAASAAAPGDFADALGAGGEYRRLLGAGRGTDEMRKFLGHFQNNLDLLIQKTWVEKTDEARKERLQDRVPPFVELIVAGDFRRATAEFGLILEELAYLLFGSESSGDGFAEYVFRIDTGMGLFWWYGSRLRSKGGELADGVADDERLWALLLVGICYLTNF